MSEHPSGLFTVSVCVMSNFTKSRVLALQVFLKRTYPHIHMFETHISRCFVCVSLFICQTQPRPAGLIACPVNCFVLVVVFCIACIVLYCIGFKFFVSALMFQTACSVLCWLLGLLPKLMGCLNDLTSLCHQRWGEEQTYIIHHPHCALALLCFAKIWIVCNFRIVTKIFFLFPNRNPRIVADICI